MKIIGFSISKISALRKNPIKGKLEINSNIDLKDIKTEEINISSDPSLKFDFEFKVDYSPKFAEVEIEGSIVAIDDKGESKEILKEWKKKNLKAELKIPLFNFIMDKCNLKALQLEEELHLPIHINLPKITTQKQEE